MPDDDQDVNEGAETEETGTEDADDTHRPTWTEELEIIRNNHGGILRVADVVAYAGDPNTALHSRFEWDDSKAAHQHRLDQARRLIRLVIHRIPVQERVLKVRSYTHLDQENPEGGGYRRTEDVLSDAALRRQMLLQFRVDMEHLQDKYQKYSDIVSAIEGVIQSVAS